MNIIYPDNWSNISLPNVRLELMSYLREIIESETSLSVEDLEFSIHFFFDDHDFEKSEELVGEVFFDATEADEIKKFVSLYGSAIGPTKEIIAINSNDWLLLKNSAESTYSLLSRRGEV